MKSRLIGWAIASALLGTTATQAESLTAQAQVLEARPVYEDVRVPTEKEVCWQEQVRHRDHRSRTPSLLGAVIGGVIGHQFGDGRGQDALTVAGALIGASAGRDIEKRRNYRSQPHTVQRCRVEQSHYYKEQRVGYEVRYEFEGQVYQTRTQRDPGRTLAIEVSHRPVEY